MSERPSQIEWLANVAEVTAHRSEDPFVKVGAVVIRQDFTVIGMGYNGTPPGVELPPTLLHDRHRRRPFMIHAEMNAIRYAIPGQPWAVVSTHLPCPHCMNVLGSYQTSVVYYLNALGPAYDETTIKRIADLNGIVLRKIPNNTTEK